MNFFQNPEIRKMCRLGLLVTAGFSVGGFVLGLSVCVTVSRAWQIVLLVFAACICLMAIFLLTLFRRQLKISSLALEIDRFLHNGRNLNLSRYSEGDIAVLTSKIEKMTLRLREQSEILQRDKTYLADSLADISHQIRTPLTSMNLLLTSLSDPDLPPEKQRRAVMEISRLCSRMDWLISTLLKISRLDTGVVVFRKDEVSVPDLVQRAIEPVAVAMDLKGQTFKFSADKNAVFTGDMNWTAEALTNIFKNCMEHTPPGGMIAVRVKNTNIFTEITVRDTGPGISPEDLPHLFERFYKGCNSSEESFGIGLALARMIVTAQNGTIKAGNCKNGGAAFVIRFYPGVL